MSAIAHANPPVNGESKSARKKKAKAEAATVGTRTPDKERSGSIAGLDESKSEGAGQEHLRELQKQQRNITKKLTGTARVDAIIAENPGKSLDELVAAKLINNDQKSQAERKPHLQAQLKDIEAKIVQMKKIDADYQGEWTKQKELLAAAHAKEKELLAAELAAAHAQEMQQQEVRITAELKKDFKTQLLLISRFLKAAATRRNAEEGEVTHPEGRAFEGVLSSVYYGDASAVMSMEKLLAGANDKVVDWQGEVDVTYARVKELTLQEAPVDEPVEEDPDTSIPSDPLDTAAGADSAAYPTDPTIANAGLTEIDNANGLTNGIHDEPSVPPAAGIGEGNAAGDKRWDTAAPGDSAPGMEESFEVVPRPADEVENHDNAAAPTSTTSWAEESEDAARTITNGNGNDGFSEVNHQRGGRGRGGFRGDARGGRGRGEFRGRGRGRGGEFRGRGRGAPRESAAVP